MSDRVTVCKPTEELDRLRMWTDDAAAEITRLRADREAMTKALNECADALEAMRADLAAAQERERALREALARLEAMVRILPPEMDEPGSALAQARAALGEPQ